MVLPFPTQPGSQARLSPSVTVLPPVPLELHECERVLFVVTALVVDVHLDLSGLAGARPLPCGVCVAEVGVASDEPLTPRICSAALRGAGRGVGAGLRRRGRDAAGGEQHTGPNSNEAVFVLNIFPPHSASPQWADAVQAGRSPPRRNRRAGLFRPSGSWSERVERAIRTSRRADAYARCPIPHPGCARCAFQCGGEAPCHFPVVADCSRCKVGSSPYGTEHGRRGVSSERWNA